MTSLTKFDLPTKDPDQQRLFAATAGWGRELPVRFGNDLWTLKCTQEHAPWTPEISLPLRIANEEAVLELSFTPGGMLFNRHAEFRQVASMSEPFALAIRSTLNREILDSLQTAFDTGVEICPTPIASAPPLVFAFLVLDASGSCEAKGLLRIGGVVSERIEILAKSWTKLPNPALLTARQSLALCVSRLDLQVSEFSSLRVGDCLILGDTTAWPFPLFVSAGGEAVPAGIRPNASLPPLFEFKNQSNMNTQIPDSVASSSDLANLRLPVLIVAGRKEMTLEQLSALREGEAIELGNGEDIPVEIQVNNQIVAAGRLVRVADKICASISEIRLPQQA